MNIVFQHLETTTRNYQGITLDDPECMAHLKGAVKDNLVDREQRNELLDSLNTLKSDTGFDTNDQLLADIQALEEMK
jgi:urease gamma subunit